MRQALDQTLETRTPGLLRGHDEQILVVEDDAGVLDITLLALTTHGYRVLSAGDGAEALVLYAQHAATIRAVLTGLQMPHMDGLGFIRALRHVAPAAKIIASTGADVNEPRRLEESHALGVNGILPKPFSIAQLLSIVRDVLTGVRDNEQLHPSGHAAMEPVQTTQHSDHPLS